jgi:hypothetical protein
MGPVGGKDVVGLAAEQEIERRREGLAHGGADDVVPICRGPAAIFEAAGGVFFRAARRLHDTVEAEERSGYDLSHGDTPFNASHSGLTNP